MNARTITSHRHEFRSIHRRDSRRSRRIRSISDSCRSVADLGAGVGIAMLLCACISAVLA